MFWILFVGFNRGLPLLTKARNNAGHFGYWRSADKCRRLLWSFNPPPTAFASIRKIYTTHFFNIHPSPSILYIPYFEVYDFCAFFFGWQSYPKIIFVSSRFFLTCVFVYTYVCMCMYTTHRFISDAIDRYCQISERI